MFNGIGSALGSLGETITNALNGLLSGIQNFFRSFLENYQSGFNSIIDFLGNFFNGLGSVLSNFFTSFLENYQSGLNSIVNFFSDFWNGISSLFVPSDEFWDSDPFGIISVAIENKFDFIEGFRTAFEVFNNTKGQTLNYEFDILGQHFAINFEWYEAYRLQVRSLFGTLFLVYSALRCFKMISGIFGVQLGEGGSSGTSGTLSVVDNNSSITRR